MSGVEWSVKVPALRGDNSRGIRHLESFLGRLEGALSNTLMLVRRSKFGMKNLCRMQFLKRFFVDVRQVDTRSNGSSTRWWRLRLIPPRLGHNLGNADWSDSQPLRQTQSHHLSLLFDSHSQRQSHQYCKTTSQHPPPISLSNLYTSTDNVQRRCLSRPPRHPLPSHRRLDQIRHLYR